VITQLAAKEVKSESHTSDIDISIRVIHLHELQDILNTFHEYQYTHITVVCRTNLLLTQIDCSYCFNTDATFYAHFQLNMYSHNKTQTIISSRPTS